MDPSTNPDDYKDILITLHTATWCESCQKPELKASLGDIQKSFVFGIFEWDIKKYESRDDVPEGVKIPKVEISRISTRRKLEQLVGVTEIIQGLETALDDWVD